MQNEVKSYMIFLNENDLIESLIIYSYDTNLLEKHF